MADLRKWLDSGEYLPPQLRDFHDQKNTFKAIHEIISENESTKEITWREAHCYVIDVFLWFMACRGYTLQKSRKNIEFGDLESDVAKQKEIRNATFYNALMPSKETP